MSNFIRLQYRMYLSGNKSIGLEKIKALAKIYMTKEERNELFGEEGDSDG